MANTSTPTKRQLTPKDYIFRTGDGIARFMMVEHGTDGLGHSSVVEYPFRKNNRKLSRKETIAYCFERVAQYYPNLTI